MDNPRLFLDYLNLKYDLLNEHADVKQVMEREGFQAQFVENIRIIRKATNIQKVED